MGRRRRPSAKCGPESAEFGPLRAEVARTSVTFETKFGLIGISGRTTAQLLFDVPTFPDSPTFPEIAFSFLSPLLRRTEQHPNARIPKAVSKRGTNNTPTLWPQTLHNQRAREPRTLRALPPAMARLTCWASYSYRRHKYVRCRGVAEHGSGGRRVQGVRTSDAIVLRSSEIFATSGIQEHATAAGPSRLKSLESRIFSNISAETPTRLHRRPDEACSEPEQEQVRETGTPADLDAPQPP